MLGLFRARRERLHIAVLSFNRPDYLRQVLKSLRRQISSRDEVLLMQDGAVNPWSGQRKASPDDIQACMQIFRKIIPWGTVLEAPRNLGVAFNYERAERHLFETLQRTHALILEDDLVLAPDYLKIIAVLLEMAAKDRRIAYVSAYGNMSASQLDQSSKAHELMHMHENWGSAIRREAWLDERAFRLQYLKLLEHQDYSLRDHAKISRFYAERGWTTSTTSQDAARWIACLELGKVRVTPYTCHAFYIGETGEHFTPELYDAGGYSRTTMYKGARPVLLPPTSDQIERWLEIERERFAPSTAAASQDTRNAAVE